MATRRDQRDMKLAPLALSLLALTACPLDDFEIHDSVTDGPIEGRVALAPMLDPMRVRAGLFAVGGPAELELDDGTRVDGNGYIDILVSREGKAKLDGAWTEDAQYDIERLTAVRFAPAFPAAIDGGRLTADLPEPERDAEFVLVVWYDDDEDGLLELSASEDGELARSVGREFPGSGRLFVYSISAWGEDPVTWKVHAGGGNEDDGYVENDVSDRELDDWSVTLDETL